MISTCSCFCLLNLGRVSVPDRWSLVILVRLRQGSCPIFSDRYGLSNHHYMVIHVYLYRTLFLCILVRGETFQLNNFEKYYLNNSVGIWLRIFQLQELPTKSLYTAVKIYFRRTIVELDDVDKQLIQSDCVCLLIGGRSSAANETWNSEEAVRIRTPSCVTCYYLLLFGWMFRRKMLLATVVVAFRRSR